MGHVMTADRAVCYVSSKDYLLPSMVSAAGVRRYVSPDTAKIYIFATSGGDDLIKNVNRALADLKIEIISVGGGALEAINSENFEGYITSTTLGRFFLADLVPPSTQKIIYIDGDTLIRGDPGRLIEAEIPEGRLAAAEDIISFRAGGLTKAGRHFRTYFSGLGIGDRGYFNSGVILVRKKTWSELAPAAYQFFKENRALCECVDQSALNAVCEGRRLKLSLKWNFQSPARFLGIDRLVNPAIYHFNQYIKPWMAVCKPWEHVYPQYMRDVAPFTELGLMLPMVTEDDIRNHNRLNPAKNLLLRSPALARLAAIHTGVRAYERAAWM